MARLNRQIKTSNPAELCRRPNVKMPVRLVVISFHFLKYFSDIHCITLLQSVKCIFCKNSHSESNLFSQSGPGSPNTQHSSSSSNSSSGSSVAAGATAVVNNNSYSHSKQNNGFDAGKASVYGSATATNLSPVPMTTMHSQLSHAPFMTSSLVSSLSPFSTGVLSTYHPTDIKNTLTSFI